jgi:dUTP pyrophosphatase
MTIKFKKLNEKAVMPVRAHKNDAGFDLTSTRVTTEVSECGQLTLVYHTDIAVEIPEGYFGMLVCRSSISKKSLALCNAVGTIDAGYRGEIMAKFKVTTDVIPALYKEGERFAQLLILPVPDVEFVEADELSETERNDGGFGSTDEEIQSAPNASAGFPESESELTNQAGVDAGSGEVQGDLEQA